MTTRIGTFCFRHAWLVLAGWLVVAVAGVLSFGPLFDRMDQQDDVDKYESQVGYGMLESGAPEGESVVALLPRGTPVPQGLEDLPGVTDVRLVTPRTGDDVAVEVMLAPGASYDAVVDRLRAAGPDVRIGGGAVLDDEIDEQVSTDLANAEKYAFPITAIALVIVFAGVVAAGLPLLGMAVTVLGAVGMLLGFSQVLGLDPSVVNVVTMLGMALSIDYGLLMVARYREELADNPDRLAAVARTWATAGRTVSFSGLTVAVALTSLLFVDLTFVRAIGSAGIATAVVAMAASLTLTPAMLRLVGRRVGARKRAHRDGRFFAALAGFTQRRPWLVVIGTSGLLLAAAAPLLGTALKMGGLERLPDEIESVAVAKQLDARYDDGADPSIVVVAEVTPADLGHWAQQWDGRVRSVSAAEDAGNGVSVVSFVVEGDVSGPVARDLVDDMRAQRPSDASWVTGDAAEEVDVLAVLADGLPLVVGFAPLGMFVLMFLMTGSVVVPLKAIAMTALSTAATFGILVMVFDWGWLSGPLDTLPMNGVSPINLVMIFAFATALAMDYEMFLLGRVVELVQRGVQTDLAVRQGLQRSGRLITSAALLMLIVYAGFAAGKVGDIEQIGVGLFTAVLIDATVVRCLLVPATMTLLGRRNWWSPALLTRVHERVGVREKELVDA